MWYRCAALTIRRQRCISATMKRKSSNVRADQIWTRKLHLKGKRAVAAVIIARNRDLAARTVSTEQERPCSYPLSNRLCVLIRYKNRRYASFAARARESERNLFCRTFIFYSANWDQATPPPPTKEGAGWPRRLLQFSSVQEVGTPELHATCSRHERATPCVLRTSPKN
jgi:hypothetical protein